MKNIEKKKVLILKDEVNYCAGQVVSKTLEQNSHHSVTLFSFDKNEEISSHRAGGDAFVYILDGKAEITIDEEKFILTAGETIVMPKDHPHALFALEQFKMLLVVTFD